MTPQEQRAYWYRHFRAHGDTAEAAWNSARSQIYFRAKLSADVAAYKRRSKAAKAAWKRRRRTQSQEQP